MILDLAVIATTFALIFPAELPDKTFIATLVLSTRYRHLPVWLGVSAAFAVQSIIAVAAGGLLALLPARLVLGVTASLFVIGAVVLVRGGLKNKAAENQVEADEEGQIDADLTTKMTAGVPASSWKIFATSFLVLFAAEWGDLSQLLTAGLAARTGEPLSVFIGSWAALILVGGLAVIIGRVLRQRIPLWRIRLVSGVILGILAGWTILEFIQA